MIPNDGHETPGWIQILESGGPEVWTSARMFTQSILVYNRAWNVDTPVRAMHIKILFQPQSHRR